MKRFRTRLTVRSTCGCDELHSRFAECLLDSVDVEAEVIVVGLGLQTTNRQDLSARVAPDLDRQPPVNLEHGLLERHQQRVRRGVDHQLEDSVSRIDTTCRQKISRHSDIAGYFDFETSP